MGGYPKSKVHMKTIIEPFRTKMVEPICFTTRSEREQLLAKAGFNLFNLTSEEVIIDFLTDSGTSAMSQEQWSALMRSDESYAGCTSFYRFREAVQRIFGFSEVIPVHQGRAAERLLFGAMIKPGDIVPSNTHFDTTRANLEYLGAKAVDFPVIESSDFESDYPFKGNIDLGKVRDFIASQGTARIPMGMITITNNSAGGQPVGLDNISSYSEILHAHGIPLYIDAARFAENAWLIKQRDHQYQARSVQSIAEEMFALADGCLMSAKKDGLANMGGFIATRDPGLACRIKDMLILTEGFPTYGGLSGRDLETIAVGLDEVLSESYLQYREAASRYLARGLAELNVPMVKPPGLHAIYLDARKFLPHIPLNQYPGQALACELYLEAGIRSCEIGSVMFGRQDTKTGQECPAQMDFVRLALPRRVYTQSHYDYVIEAVTNVFKRRESVAGMKFVYQPERLRHFSATFARVADIGGACHCTARAMAQEQI